jgi:L-ascorbate metabolism protein UlaG (beta-lactamase superfamily)
MRLRLIRHATLIIEFSGRTIIVDPMLDDAGARPPIEHSPNPRNNPLVPLPLPADEILRKVEAVLVTHTHSDHWDATADKLLPKHLPFFSQPEDAAKFRAQGFTAVQPIDSAMVWSGTEITRTRGQHGKGDLARMLAPVSGFVLRAPGEPTLYIAGDSVWCPEVETALKAFQPEVVVLNAGGARFLEGEPITMTADDVIAVCHEVPRAQIVAVHMEAINHCLLNRADLEFQLEAERVFERVAIPNDGGWVGLK